MPLDARREEARDARRAALARPPLPCGAGRVRSDKESALSRASGSAAARSGAAPTWLCGTLAPVLSSRKPGGANQRTSKSCTTGFSITCVQIGRAALDPERGGARRVMYWEGPVGRGKDSRFHIPGQDTHSTVFHVPCVQEFMEFAGAQPVYFDQQALGQSAPKTTALYCSPNMMPAADELFGTLPLGVPDGERATVGFDADGKSKAKPLARYPLAMRMRLAVGEAFISPQAISTAHLRS